MLTRPIVTIKVKKLSLIDGNGGCNSHQGDSDRLKNADENTKKEEGDCSVSKKIYMCCHHNLADVVGKTRPRTEPLGSRICDTFTV